MNRPSLDFDFHFIDFHTNQPLLDVPQRLKEINYYLNQFKIVPEYGAYNSALGEWAVQVRLHAFQHRLLFADGELKVVISNDIMLENIRRIVLGLYTHWINQRIFEEKESYVSQDAQVEARRRPRSSDGVDSPESGCTPSGSNRE